MDFYASLLLIWFIIDFIAISVDIWLRLRHHGWHVEKVKKDDVKTIMKLLDENYNYILETEDYFIFRREHD